MSDFISGFFSWGKKTEKVDADNTPKKPKQFDPLTIKKEEEE